MQVYLFGSFVLLTTVVLFVCVCVCLCVCSCCTPHRYTDIFCKQEFLNVRAYLAQKKKKKKLILILARVHVCIHVCVSQQHML